MTDEELKQAIEELDDTKAQPKREWVGLTDEEIVNIVDTQRTRVGFDVARLGYRVARAVEAKLKEKNT